MKRKQGATGPSIAEQSKRETRSLRQKGDVAALIAAAVDPEPHGLAPSLADHASTASLAIHDPGNVPAGVKRSKAIAARGAAKSTLAEAIKPVRFNRSRSKATPLEAAEPAQTFGLTEKTRSSAQAEPIAVPSEALDEAALEQPERAKAASHAGPGAEPQQAEGSQPVDSARAEPQDGPAEAGSGGATSPDPQAAALADAEILARSVGKFIEHSGQAAAAFLKPRESGSVKPPGGEDVVNTMNSLGRIAESWIANPARMIQAQMALSTQLFSLWSDSFTKATGSKTDEAPASPAIDRRFASPEWQSSPVFDFLHRAYLATTEWAKTMVADAEGVDQDTRDRAAFYLRQISSALSPSNFLLTNPELLKATFDAKGENLVRGMRMLAEDIAAGKGELKIRQSDASQFTLGVDMASTPGKVVFRNDLIELIQYAPSTPEVLKRPLLIVPPWINKFYVLDLNAEKSFIRWTVLQGVTVFVISWVNPDERHGAKDWDAYMREGIFAALDAIEAAVGETDVSTVGYCVGGTLLAATLAYMASTNDKRVTSSTFLTTQVDFKEAGDLKIFADEAQVRALEQQMKEDGYLAGSRMANAFNMLRPDDLIWSYAVNAYIKGKPPAAFDLLAWNADSTRMSAANHAFYLRNCYIENNLTRGKMVLGGQTLDLGLVTIPIYDLATREDHIAPARSVYIGAKFFGGPVRYVLAGSGHIAGVVNPPSKAKYQFWADGKTDGDYEAWVKTAVETKGTWWPDWMAWLKAQAPNTVTPRVPGAGGLPALVDAPGDYVRVQA